MSKTENGGGNPRYSKIDIAKYRYNLGDLDEQMREWYEEEDKSYRTIEKEINKLILKKAMEKAGEETVFEGHAENLLQLIRGDDENVSNEARQDAINHLESLGVDVDRVKGDFVSHQTVGNYLKNRLDVDPKKQSPPDINKTRKTIRKLQTRLEAVAQRSLSRLNDEGIINVGTINLNVTVKNWCDECGKSMTVSELLSEKSCDCHPNPDEEQLGTVA